MPLGSILVITGLVATLLSIAAYATHAVLLQAGKTAAETRVRRILSAARASYLVMALAVTAASTLLMVYLLTHQFQFKYVTDYSSRDLHTMYLVSTFWAGQEGTLLLWALMAAWLGFALRRTAPTLESYAMPFFLAVSAMLLWMVARLAPFSILIPTPEDGKGLNPLLQNPWMVWHPPAIFLGYCATAAPFALAMGALWKRDYDDWARPALPWTAFAWLALGLGVCLGGYWAYIVLGWGGYWAWDPVENSSLVPWVLLTALLHGLIAQQRRQVMQRTNLTLPWVTLMSVWYGTFLTRSGVLEDFSVHSFSDVGLGGPLMSALALFGMTGLGLLCWRWSLLPRGEGMRVDSREFIFSLGVGVLCLSALCVAFGMSSPLLSRLVLAKPSSLETSFYNVTHVPLAIAMAVLVALSLALSWKGTPKRQWRRMVTPAAGAALVTAIALVAGGIRLPAAVVLVSVSVGALVASVLAYVREHKGKLAAGPVAHVGLALMFIGIIVSSLYTRSRVVTLPEGKDVKAFGYRLRYTPHERPGEKLDDKLPLRAKRNGKEYRLTPRMYFSSYMQSTMRNPAVKPGLAYDLYISPLEEQEAEESSSILLAKGESADVAGHKVKFEKFAINSHDGEFEVGCQLLVDDGSAHARLTPTWKASGDSADSRRAVFEPSGAVFEVKRILADQGRIELAVQAPRSSSAGRTAVVEVSRKPLMDVLWLGAVLCLLGGLIAVWLRFRRSGAETGYGV